MKRNRCCVVPFLLLTSAQGFGTKLAPLNHYGSVTGYHQCCSKSRQSNTVVSCQSAEGSAKRDNRIDANPEALQQWFSSAGGAIGPVGLEETPRFGWGLKAERDIELGEKLATIPRCMCIGSTAAAQGEEGADDNNGVPDEDKSWMGPPELQALVEKVPRTYPDLRLGLFLLHERYKAGSSSKWEPYISNLPKRFKGVPLASFGAVEMRGMQDIALAGKIDQRRVFWCKFMMSFIKRVLDPLTPGPGSPFGEHRVGFGDLAWATAAVSSRAFTRLDGAGGVLRESTPLLVPFMDLLNFNFVQGNVQVVSAWPSYRGDGGDGREGVLVEFDEEEWEYERPEEPEVWLVATRPVAAGDSLEVKEDYGNERWLCNYGFVDINRRRERNHFRFEKKILRAARIHAGILDEQFGSKFEQDGLEPWQQRALIELKLDGPEQDLTVYLGGDSTNGRLPVDGRLLAALRVMFTRSRREMEGKTVSELSRYKTGKLSDYVERRVLATVLGLVSVYGQRWPSTQEQDEEILYGRQVPPSYREKLSLPPPWQDRVLPEVPVGHLETREVAWANALQARGSEAKERCAEKKVRDDGNEGEDQGKKEDGMVGAQDVQEDEDEHEGEDGGDDDGVLRVNPELSWEMSQAVAFRYAKKRTLSDVSLIAMAELRGMGLVEGMLENAKIDVRSFAKGGLEGRYPVVDDDELPLQE
ncbi:unnamed protein product [Ectocarpus sp. 4 AP-2014]